ncbi:hypothetical protein [Streptosporangium sp. NPDC000396]|uniref:hypothetical protein n=1 Tax=Streptosporangium sp. NPDC000396 TaxID=3366185 RepID=UPI00367FF6F2
MERQWPDPTESPYHSDPQALEARAELSVLDEPPEEVFPADGEPALDAVGDRPTSFDEGEEAEDFAEEQDEESGDGTMPRHEISYPAYDVSLPSPGHSLYVEQHAHGDNDGKFVGIELNVYRRALEPHALKPEYVQRVAANYVASKSFHGVAVEFHLREKRIAVIVAPEDHGRHMAAVYLLAQRPDIRPHEYQGGSRADFKVQDLEMHKDTAWLLDFRDSLELSRSFGRSLAAAADGLARHNSIVVAIVTPKVWANASEGGSHLAVELENPAPVAILRRRLEAARSEDRKTIVDDPESWIAYVDSVGLLREAAPAEAVRLADSVINAEQYWKQANRDARDQLLAEYDKKRDENGEIGKDKVIEIMREMVVSAHKDWRNFLLEWNNNNQDSQVRTFQLAASVLDGAPAGHIFQEATKLAAKLGDSLDVVGLRGHGILHLVSQVKATLEDGDVVRFRRPGFADAVLDYFWIDREHLQEEFLVWLRTLVHQSDLDDDATMAVINRIADYAVRWTRRKNDFKLVADLMRSWSDAEKLRPFAVQLATSIALSSDLGRKMRDLLLQWSKREAERGIRRSTPGLQRVVAQICGGELGRVYPKLAVTRLAYLADVADSKTMNDVLSAVKSLWCEADARTELLESVSALIDADDAARRRRGVNAFLSIAGISDDSGDTPLILSHAHANPEDTTISRLVTCWRAVLDAPNSGLEDQKIFRAWMNAAASDPTLSSLTIEIIYRAAVGEAGNRISRSRLVRLGELRGAWRTLDEKEWDPARHDVFQVLQEKIQDIDPLNTSRTNAQHAS